MQPYVNKKQGEKVLKFKVVAKDWWLMAKILVATNLVNLYCFIPASLRIGTNSPELSSLKFCYHHSQFLAACHLGFCKNFHTVYSM